MAESPQSGGELFIVDNSDEHWKELRYLQDSPRIADVIRSTPETPRICTQPAESLREIRLKVEKHIKNTYLKQLQAPVGVKPQLKCWMEIN